MIRISQKDIYYKKIKWRKELKKYFFLHKEPTYYFISSDQDLYNEHKTKLEGKLTEEYTKQRFEI